MKMTSIKTNSYPSYDVNQRQRQIPQSNGRDFQSIYQQSLRASFKPIKVSNHALQRLEQRGLELTEQDLEQLKGSFERAALKGAKESVVMYKEMMLVASVQNRTIITVIGQQDSSEEIFTNIDSAIIVNE